jgi:hypothetical protein
VPLWQGGLLPVEYEHYQDLLLERSAATGSTSGSGPELKTAAAPGASGTIMQVVDIAALSTSADAVLKEEVDERGRTVLPRRVHLTASQVSHLD